MSNALVMIHHLEGSRPVACAIVTEDQVLEIHQKAMCANAYDLENPEDLDWTFDPQTAMRDKMETYKAEFILAFPEFEKANFYMDLLEI